MSNGQLKAFVERIERLEGEKDAISEDIKEIFGEVKSEGFDVKILRKIIRIRKVEPHVRSEEETIMDLYMRDLGMGPLFDGGGE